jgi:regulatory protein YycI of two-component signal transduction system YycFG
LSKKTLISINLSEAELNLLAELSEKKEMSKSAVLRQALRIMGLIEQRISQGEKFYLESADKEKSEILLV